MCILLFIVVIRIDSMKEYYLGGVSMFGEAIVSVTRRFKNNEDTFVFEVDESKRLCKICKQFGDHDSKNCRYAYDWFRS